MEKNLTTGSVFKNVVLLSLPYLLSYFLQTLYGMADLFIIGQFEGVASTTAVSIGSQVMHMLTVMIVGLSMGTTVSVGQAVGAGNRKQAAHNIGNTVILFLVLSIALRHAVIPCSSHCRCHVYASGCGERYGHLFDHLLYRDSGLLHPITSSVLFLEGWATAKARCALLPQPVLPTSL